MTTDGARNRVLVVEDETVIAFEIEDALESLGCEVVGPVSTLERALELAQSGAVDGAILDVTVRGGKTYPVAELLRAQGIPFLFATGQSDWSVPTALRTYPCLAKPFTTAELERHLRSLGIEIAKRKSSAAAGAIQVRPDTRG